jgi:hypothetical protein
MAESLPRGRGEGITSARASALGASSSSRCDCRRGDKRRQRSARVVDCLLAVEHSRRRKFVATWWGRRSKRREETSWCCESGGAPSRGDAA